MSKVLTHSSMHVWVRVDVTTSRARSFEPSAPTGMSLREDGFQARPAWRRGVVSSVIIVLSCRSCLA
eukprot:2517729-Pyramimonas_sp.AAC.1